MNGEMNLKTLFTTMRPLLHQLPFVFCTVRQEIYDKLSFDPLCTYRELEGISVITTQQQASENGLLFDMTWACITLRVHSSLSAVGFLAAITGRLAQVGISVNPVSAYYHDHLFVPWESRTAAMEILKELNNTGSATTLGGRLGLD
jgi:hypothetical protein